MANSKSLEAAFQKIVIDNPTNNDLSDVTLQNLNRMKLYDKATYLHELRVALIARRLAMFCGYSDLKPELYGGANHDFGKVFIKKDILKSKEITPSEYEAIKAHPLKGAQALDKYYFVSVIIGMHHSHQKISYGPKDELGTRGSFGKDVEKRLNDAVFNVALADFFDALMTRLNSFNKKLLNKKSAMISVYPDFEERIEFLFTDEDVRKIVEPYQPIDKKEIF